MEISRKREQESPGRVPFNLFVFQKREEYNSSMMQYLAEAFGSFRKRKLQ